MLLVEDKFFLTEMQIEVVGLKELSTLYQDDFYFGEAWKACTEPITFDKTRWCNFMI